MELRQEPGAAGGSEISIQPGQIHDSKLLVDRLLPHPQPNNGVSFRPQEQPHSQAAQAAQAAQAMLLNLPVEDSPQPQQQQQQQQGGFKKPNSSAAGGGKSSGKAVSYRECMKNHAAAIGGHALDGCGEFMPAGGGTEGAAGSMESLRCAACDCHRNFHKREVEGEPLICDICHLNRRDRNRRAAAIAAGVKSPAAAVPPAAPTTSDSAPGSLMIVPQQQQQQQQHQHLMSMKKRFRTKFSAEQKERMYGLAEKLGWRIQKQDEAAVQQFCAEVGVKRHVLKVWMHNNKHTFTRRTSSGSPRGTAGGTGDGGGGTASSHHLGAAMNLLHAGGSGAAAPMHYSIPQQQQQQQQHSQQQQMISS